MYPQLRFKQVVKCFAIVVSLLEFYLECGLPLISAQPYCRNVVSQSARPTLRPATQPTAARLPASEQNRSPSRFGRRFVVAEEYANPRVWVIGEEPREG